MNVPPLDSKCKVTEKLPTLRYFARFKCPFGYIRAVIRYGSTRKYVLTPILISAEQSRRLDSSGHINQPQSDADYILEGRLREYTNYIWQTVKPLIDSGAFAATRSELLTTAIIKTMKAEEAKKREDYIAGQQRKTMEGERNAEQ